ncbi:class I SAM-dependent DNA methyltransferase [Shimia aestuarii]|uniref:Methyltransferase domain-containing protein n=1 Tax=Shimia aestuarii TaxID=254406 RepID=A0A1I4JVD9_9RHOB|nr:class I SAM-dependent methyltransferase [Shimia aestuarii]SFL70424.1 Methyltransferase domain-containing protein [Shimia aestuarii]
MSPKKDPNLEAAYSLKTPQDSRRLYRDWAQTYDTGFAQASDYVLPREVARYFVEAGGVGPVLDVGAGTGLCGAILTALGTTPCDATDISQEMLDVADTKSIYRTLFVGDLTKRLPVEDATYDGIVSSGTFTNGHVGPDALDELLRITRPGALFALSIHERHFETVGFRAKLDALSDRICDLHLPKARVYGESAHGPHKDDRCFIALFHRL